MRQTERFDAGRRPALALSVLASTLLVATISIYWYQTVSRRYGSQSVDQGPLPRGAGNSCTAGIAAAISMSWLRSLWTNIRFVITDHHLPGDTPPAAAIINPGLRDFTISH